MRTEFETGDPQVAWAFLHTAFGTDVRLTGEPGPLRVVHGDLGPVRVDELDYAVGLTYETGGNGWLSVAQAMDGWTEVAGPEGTERLVRGTLVAVPPQQPVSGRSGPRIRQRVVHVDADRLARAVRDRGDEQSDGTVTFAQLSVHGRGSTQPWQSLSEFISRTAAATPVLLEGRLAESALAQLVAHTALSLFANDTWAAPSEAALARDSLDGTSAAVRRAVAFIDGAAHTDITLADIAGAAYVTPRALQYGFRRRLDTTPMAYLRKVRLHHARAELLAPEAGATVASVAGRWGFFHLGRFARYYRDEFGENPAQTLESRG